MKLSGIKCDYNNVIRRRFLQRIVVVAYLSVPIGCRRVRNAPRSAALETASARCALPLQVFASSYASFIYYVTLYFPKKKI